MNTPPQKGFTLIELLVVISIIGLLTSIVLAALQSAKIKAQDARVISEMVSLRNSMALLITSTGKYSNDNSCVTDTTGGIRPVFFGTNIQDSFSVPCSLSPVVENTLVTSPKIFVDLATLTQSTYENHPSYPTNFMIGVTQTSYVITAIKPSAMAAGIEQYICIDSSDILKTENLTWSSTYNFNSITNTFTCK